MIRFGTLVLPLMALAVACVRDPDVGKFTCTSSAHCPDGYLCTGSSAVVGRCIRTTPALDAVADNPQTTVDSGTSADSPQLPVALDAATAERPGIDLEGSDLPIGGSDSSVGGSGGTTWLGTGGTVGSGGNVSPTGGVLGSGGLGAGGLGHGGSGSGGTTVTGQGGTTGGAGGRQTGGALGTGGGILPGTGGGIPGTGGGIPGTGGTIPGTGGTIPGTGGTIPGTGGTIPSAQVSLNQTRQAIEGFGINTAMMPSSKTLPMDSLFTTQGSDGIGLSILRVGMTSTGALAGKYVAEAKASGAKIIGSTWSPPANCKSNGSTLNGGHLLEQCYDSWSTTIANFAKQQGLYAMSIASEPDFASCPGVPVCTDAYDTTTYTAKEMVAWLKVAGAKLKAAGVKVIAPEVAEWIHLWSNASATGSIVAGHPNSSDPLKCGCFSNTPTETGCAQTCLDGNGYDYGHWLWKDQSAWQAFDILGVHQYDSQVAYPWPADVNAGLRNKDVWQTEMSGLMHWPEQGPSMTIDNGVVVAGWIHSALTVGEASAWLWWWYESYYQDDNEGLALIKGSATIAKRYYTLGNFSKFIRPGYTRVNVGGAIPADVLLSAYKGTDGTVVIVAINTGSAAANVPITISGGTAPASLTPWVTSASDNLAAKTAVATNAGFFTGVLAGKSVTTFVGK